jgi:hypothetical protein
VEASTSKYKPALVLEVKQTEATSSSKVPATHHHISGAFLPTNSRVKKSWADITEEEEDIRIAHGDVHPRITLLKRQQVSMKTQLSFWVKS